MVALFGGIDAIKQQAIFYLMNSETFCIKKGVKNVLKRPVLLLDSSFLHLFLFNM